MNVADKLQTTMQLFSGNFMSVIKNYIWRVCLMKDEAAVSIGQKKFNSAILVSFNNFPSR